MKSAKEFFEAPYNSTKEEAIKEFGFYMEKNNRMWLASDLFVMIDGAGAVCCIKLKETEHSGSRFTTAPLTQKRRALFAHVLFLARQSRYLNPEGSFDGAKRWTPQDGEEQACCSSIRCPSRRWPFSLMTHCRSIKHVANLCQTTEQEVKTGKPAKKEKKTTTKQEQAAIGGWQKEGEERSFE